MAAVPVPVSRWKSHHAMNADSQLVDRAYRLFTFLARAEGLKSPRVRTVDAYQSEDQALLWIAELPEHEAVHVAFRDWEPDDGRVLWIDRIPPVDPPPLPSSIAKWVTGDGTNPNAEPTLLERVRKESANWSDGYGSERSWDVLEDHPDVQASFDRWIGAWRNWAEHERRNVPVRRAYERLFRIHANTEGRSEEFELLLGTGLLSWAPESHVPVRRHICTVPMATRIDDRSGTIEVAIDPSAIGLRTELDMLDPSHQPHRTTVFELETRARDFGEHPLDADAFEDLGRLFVNHLDPQGQFSGDFDAPAPSPRAVVSFAPAIILRRRSRLGMQHVLEEIAARIQEEQAVPDSLVPLVEPGSPPPATEDASPGALFHIDDAVFSPLPLNDVQRKIIDRVNSRAQVLVQGPPGTGKTHTAAALISHLLAQGKRILVTAQTDRALVEVREKLPHQIKPLAVSVIGASRSDMNELKLAVDTIARRAADHDVDEGERTIQKATQQIEALRLDRARLGRQLLEARESEVREHEWYGQKGTLAALAQLYLDQAEEHGWVGDFLDQDVQAEAPLTNAEAAELLTLLRDVTLDAEEQEAAQRLPVLTELVDPTIYANLVTAKANAESNREQHRFHEDHAAGEAIRALPPDTRVALSQQLTEVLRAIEDLGQLRATWMQDALADIRGGNPREWHERATELKDTLDGLPSLGIGLMQGHTVQVSGEFGPLLKLAEHLLAHVERSPIKTQPDGSPKIGLFTAGPVKQSARLFDEVRVDGLPPTTADQLRTLIAYIKCSWSLDRADRLWPSSVTVPQEDTLQERVGWHRGQLDQLDRVFALGAWIERTNEWLRQLDVPRPDWTDASAVARYSDVVNAVTAADAFDEASAPLETLRQSVSSLLLFEGAPTVVHELRDALETSDISRYEKCYRRIARLWDVRSAVQRRKELRERLASVAPRLAHALDHTARENRSWARRLAAFEESWRWRAMGTWIMEQDAQDPNELQAQISVVEKHIHEQVAVVASTRAWNHALGPERLTLSSRPALTHYSQLVRRLGKGTGKFAAKQRAEIRIAMDRCRPLVPVWIMPLYRIADQLNIEESMFDVVVVDEASQAGKEAMFLQYIGKTIVVIGDDKQVSPSAVGVNQGELRDLAEQLIHDDPFKASWLDPKRSLFDEAKMRFAGQLTLTEHRRCVPEIIGFSNRIAYEPDGIRLDPVRQFGSERLEPVKLVHVSEGLESGSVGNKVNVREAEALVSQLLACLKDPRYDGKTFGVISLVGSRQAQQIESLLLNRVTAEEWSTRELRCGDSAAFQGSERDVMFLSMVTGPEDGGYVRGALTQDMYLQRFNVAVSRAKDQFWLFHSVTLEQLRNKEDMRFQLLEYATDVTNRWSGGVEVAPEPVSVSTRDPRFDSLFEQRVFNKIVERGYLVTPQYEASGYRIDLVVTGTHSRLAVECDGDAWHGPEQYTADLARQRDLERCGWRFFRVRESAFYVDADSSLAGLWDLLDELDIRPVGETEGELQGSTGQLEPSEDASGQGVSDGAAIVAPVSDGHITDATAPEPTEGVEIDFPSGSSADLPGGPHHSEWATERADEDRDESYSLDKTTAEQTHFAGSGLLSPYVSFSGRTTPVGEASRSEMLDGVVRIVEAEGPVLGERIHQVYVQASGGHRVGKNIALALNRALSDALARGLVEGHDPLGRSSLKVRTFTLPGSSSTPPRELGPRSLDLVPPGELIDVLRRSRGEDLDMSVEEMFRRALALYGRKSLTSAARKNLEEARQLMERFEEDSRDPRVEIP